MKLNLQYDDRDLALIVALSRDAMQSQLSLAREVHLSHSSVARRIARLTDSGIIEGSTLRLSFEALGLPVTAIMLLKRRRDIPKENIWSQVTRHPFVRRCNLVTGAYDLVAEAIAPSLKAYGEFVSDHLLDTAGIVSVESLMVLKTLKDQSDDISTLLSVIRN